MAEGACGRLVDLAERCPVLQKQHGRLPGSGWFTKQGGCLPDCVDDCQAAIAMAPDISGFRHIRIAVARMQRSAIRGRWRRDEGPCNCSAEQRSACSISATRWHVSKASWFPGSWASGRCMPSVARHCTGRWCVIPARRAPDCAALHPGYVLRREKPRIALRSIRATAARTCSAQTQSGPCGPLCFLPCCCGLANGGPTLRSARRYPRPRSTDRPWRPRRCPGLPR